jgi:hypothetical protein
MDYGKKYRNTCCRSHECGGAEQEREEQTKEEDKDKDKKERIIDSS